MNFIKKYWAELLVFITIAVIIFTDISPSPTWMNTNSDGIHLTFAAKYLLPAHKGSAPLYLLWQHFMLMIPYGTEYWRMALMSAIPTIITAIMIYFIVRKLTGKRLIAIASCLVYGSSALVISQAIIVKYYPLVTMLGVLAYWFSLNKKWKSTALCLGASGAIHPISLFFMIPMLIGFKELRKWKTLASMALFLLFYLYIPITNRPPYMWDAPNSKGIFWFISDTLATAAMLSGQLSIWDFPKRVLDTIGILGLCFTIGLVPLVYCLWKTKWYKSLIFWLVALPVIYFVSDLAIQTYVYCLPAMAFGAIAIGIGLSLIKWQKQWTYSLIVVSSIMLGINGHYFDIGKNLDPNLSATEFYTQELPKVPDGQVLIAQQGWEWAAIYPFNANNHRNIIPVNVGSLPSDVYQQQLRDWGIKFTVPNETDIFKLQNGVLKSILDSNDNLWITQPTHPETYGAEIIPYDGNISSIVITSLINYDPNYDPNNPDWKWKPSNPYDTITGSIEILEWNNQLLSKWSILHISTFGMMGFLVVKILSKKKKR